MQVSNTRTFTVNVIFCPSKANNGRPDLKTYLAIEINENNALAHGKLKRCQTQQSMQISSAPSSIFSKSRLLATLNCKMVALKKVQSPKKNVKGRTLHDILRGGLLQRTARFQHLKYFVSVSLHIHVEFLNNERGKEKDR